MSGLVREIREETGLDASVGIGPNKLVAKVASDAEKPRGFVVLTREQAAERFARRGAAAPSRHRPEDRRAPGGLWRADDRHRSSAAPCLACASASVSARAATSTSSLTSATTRRSPPTGSPSRARWSRRSIATSRPSTSWRRSCVSSPSGSLAPWPSGAPVGGRSAIKVRYDDFTHPHPGSDARRAHQRRARDRRGGGRAAAGEPAGASGALLGVRVASFADEGAAAAPAHPTSRRPRSQWADRTRQPIPAANALQACRRKRRLPDRARGRRRRLRPGWRGAGSASTTANGAAAGTSRAADLKRNSWVRCRAPAPARGSRARSGRSSRRARHRRARSECSTPSFVSSAENAWAPRSRKYSSERPASIRMRRIARSASPWAGAIRTGSSASHRSQTSSTMRPVSISKGSSALPGRVRIGRVAGGVAVHLERPAEALPGERVGLGELAEEDVVGALEVGRGAPARARRSRAE